MSKVTGALIALEVDGQIGYVPVRQDAEELLLRLLATVTESGFVKDNKLTLLPMSDKAQKHVRKVSQIIQTEFDTRQSKGDNNV